MSLTVVFAAASGYVGAWIARGRILGHILAICILQLAVGIAIQLQHWTLLPLWYHLAFFVLFVVGIILGARVRVRGGGYARSSPMG